ncbi:2OG-Fe(II) oxygenase superfamily [Phytophthora infestans]|uniref:2OG-Fe(II) oxygenase superfamily n=1 Tax=Phytophthora infestans TaxID=4787 RepID=A0A833WFC1_PHYIN|nr:2OG-Fe(II) oxygenase superfamily [Phytophthora infestans]
MIWFDDEEYGNYDASEPTEADIFKSGKWPFGVSGKPDDIPVPKGAVCAQISNIIGPEDDKAAAAAAGEYSFGGQAETLPVSPGLFVDDVGCIALPLCDEQAKKLIAKCDKSPFGRKLDTMMDENVRKSWQLAPDQVTIKNSQWHTGMEKLRDTVASRLGYKGVPMQCKLYKMLVYGEGGHFVKHQDTEKEDGMVATMVVQLPSLHEGGDLVVYRGGEVKHRHDFGKKEGTAEYLPHYAVHYADAEHALEKVTKGYRLVLVYSVCLPSNMRGLERNPDKSKTEELAGAICCMGPEDKLFSLLLAHEYTEKSITGLGSGALKGIDRARVEALIEANQLADADKKLQLFFADLKHHASFYDAGGDWEEDAHKEAITWFSLSGEKLATASSGAFELNFLNPDQDTLEQIWEERGESTFEGYLGNEGATRNTTYSRYALVAWPVANGVENSLKLISSTAAIEALQTQRPVAPETLRKFMSAAGDKMAKTQAEFTRSQAYSYGERKKKVGVSVEFSQTLRDLLLEADDSSLVNEFFTKVCSNVGMKDNLAPTIIALVRKYQWSDISQAMLSSLEETEDTSYRYGRVVEVGDSSLVFKLQILEGLEDGPAQQALMQAAVKDAVNLRTERLCACKALASLWKWVIRAADKSSFDSAVDKFKQVEPSQLRPVLEALSEHVGDINVSDEKLTALASIAAIRIKWLKSQVQGRTEKPFTWEMANAIYPDNARIQAFLRGPDKSMTTTGVRVFSGLPAARKYANNATQTNCSFKMEPGGRGKDAFVTITKTRTWSNKQHGDTGLYNAELKLLNERFGDVTTDDGPATKRARTGP